MNRRSFLGWMVGSAGGVMGATIEPATAAQLKHLEDGIHRPEFLSLNGEGLWIKRCSVDYRQSALETDPQDRWRRYIAGLTEAEVDLTIGGTPQAMHQLVEKIQAYFLRQGGVALR
jgi:hypothetical protein